MARSKKADDEKKTEQRIFEAAEREFLNLGFSGARMQAIADAAGINKALLHYYFRSKERLYQEVFSRAFDKFALALDKLNREELSLVEMVEQFVVEVWKLTSESPSLVLFIAAEISRAQPGLVTRRYPFHELHFIKRLQAGMTDGSLRRGEPIHVLLQLFSLCFYPLQSGPMLTNLLAIDERLYKENLRGYYEALPQYLLTALKATKAAPAKTEVKGKDKEKAVEKEVHDKPKPAKEKAAEKGSSSPTLF